MPQCCYLAKGAKRPSHTTNMLTTSNNNLKIIADMEFFDAFFERSLFSDKMMKLPKPSRISINQSNSISSFNQSVSCAFVQLISRPVEVDSYETPGSFGGSLFMQYPSILEKQYQFHYYIAYLQVCVKMLCMNF